MNKQLAKLAREFVHLTSGSRECKLEQTDLNKLIFLFEWTYLKCDWWCYWRGTLSDRAVGVHEWERLGPALSCWDRLKCLLCKTARFFCESWHCTAAINWSTTHARNTMKLLYDKKCRCFILTEFKTQVCVTTSLVLTSQWAVLKKVPLVFKVVEHLKSLHFCLCSD